MWAINVAPDGLLGGSGARGDARSFAAETPTLAEILLEQKSKSDTGASNNFQIDQTSNSIMSSERMPNRKKRGLAARLPVTKNKRLKRSRQYHSSSEDEDEVEPLQNKPLQKRVERDIADASASDEDDGGIQLPNLEQLPTTQAQASDEEGDGSDEDEDDEFLDDEVEAEDKETPNTQQKRTQKKRHDPSAFAASISKILDSKLTADKRADPVLSRDRQAAENAKEMADSKLEARAKRKLKEEKKVSQDRGRVKDVMGLSTTEVSSGQIVEHEKELKKMAQRGVVKLFNAVRAAQVKAEEASKESQATGMVGVDRRQEKVNEMSKQGFLDLLVEGGNK